MGAGLGLDFADTCGRQSGPGVGWVFLRASGVRGSARPRCAGRAGRVGVAAQLVGRAGSLGSHLPWGRWKPPRLGSGLPATLLSPPQEALFVKLGCLDRRRLHVAACRIEPFSVLRGRASPALTLQDDGFGVGWGGAEGDAENRGLTPFSVHFLPVTPARPPPPLLAEARGAR